jgi:hypothetical protein
VSMRRFKRPRMLTRREQDLVILALRYEPPPNAESFLRQVRDLKAVGRDPWYRPSRIWEVFFDCHPTGHVECVVMGVGRTAKDPVSVCLFVDRGSGRLWSMEVFENSSGKPPIMVMVR